MNYKVTLHNGQNFDITFSGEKTIELLILELNDRSASFINLGGCIVQKNTVATILPITEKTQNA